MSAANNEFTAEFFNNSSDAWMANKRRRGASMVYVCAAICRTERPCSNIALPMKEFCRVHTKSVKGVRSDKEKRF